MSLEHVNNMFNESNGELYNTATGVRKNKNEKYDTINCQQLV